MSISCKVCYDYLMFIRPSADTNNCGIHDPSYLIKISNANCE